MKDFSALLELLDNQRFAVYYWPVEHRERNYAGWPGKLHAKLAIVDEVVMVSSANLTDDAFNRNMEVGVMITSAEFRRAIKVPLASLIADKTLQIMPTTN